MKMKITKTKERKIIALLIVFTMLFTGLMTSDVIFANAENAKATENEAVDYNITSDLSEDKQTSKVALTMTANENVEIQNIILPDGKEQVFNNEKVTYVSHKNEDIVFVVNYVNTQSEESKTEKLTTSIKYTVTGIEAIETKADAEETDEKATTKAVGASNKLDAITRADTAAMTTLDISKGSIEITETTIVGTTGDGSAVTEVNPSGYIIVGVGGENTISVSGATTTIVLDNMSSLTTTETSPMKITDNADVTVLLKGTNSLQTSTERTTALQVDVGSSLTIDSENTTGSSDGSLSAKSTATGKLGVGIGSGKTEAGNITILGGTIDALGGAGIGGKGASKITISGGDVTATGGQSGAGIGGYTGNCGETIINGGTVNATGGRAGAGIGNGDDGTGGTVTIAGEANVTATGGFEAAGIGLGRSGTKIDITISGNPTINATGDRAAIGGGGRENMIGTIEISGGTIIANTSAKTAIGAGSGSSGNQCNISIKDATISGIEGDSFLRGNNIRLENVKMSDPISEIKGTIDAAGTLNILAGTELKLLEPISANGAITVEDSSLIIGNDASYNTIISFGSEVNINNSIIDMKTLITSHIIRAKTNVNIKDSDITIASNSKSKTQDGINAGNTINFIESDVNIDFFNELSDERRAAIAPNINVNGGTIISNGYIYGNNNTGTISIQKGYIELTNQSKGIYSLGDINISDGYINVAKGIKTDTNSGLVNIKAVAGEGDGNAIIFASEYAGGVVNLEQGIIFYNDGAAADKKYKGYVLGDVTLGNMMEENGTQFTIPKQYTLHLQEAESAALTVPLNTKLVNEGKILNARTVTVDGAFENSNDAMVMNYNLTKGKGTAAGGEFIGSGTLTNNGDVQNEVYVDLITLDGASYNVSDASLSTITGMQSIIGDKNSNLVNARQGDNEVYYNNILGRALKSEWKYINTDLEYFTLTYDENYDGATAIPSTIVGKGKISAQEEPTRSKYVFEGWYREKTTRSSNVELGEKWNFETNEITGKTTLYAKWKKVVEAEIPTQPEDSNDSSIPSTPTNKKESPATGDTTNLIFLIMLSSISAGFILIYAMKRRKKQR